MILAQVVRALAHAVLAVPAAAAARLREPWVGPAPRECGPCHACCVELVITGEPVIGEKGMHEPCRHLAPAPAGCCAIYATRPGLCQRWLCGWRRGWGADTDRPHEAGAMMIGDPDRADLAVLMMREDPRAEAAALRLALQAEAAGHRVRLQFTYLDWSLADYRRNLGEWLAWLLEERR